MMHRVLLQLDWQDLETRIGGEKVSSFLWCIGIILATLLLKKPLARLIARLSAGIANRFTDKRYNQKFRSLIHRPLESLLQTILFYIAISQLGILLNQFVLGRYSDGRHDALALRLGDITDHIFLFLTILFCTLVLSRVVDFMYYVHQEKAAQEQNRERQQLLPLLKEVVKLVLWSIGVFWVLGSVFHVNIPALVTGLGIGGVAIALAAKESVENLFAAFTILTDKPFQAGDMIRLGTLEGSVERIGFRSTRLRSADGSAYIIPNKKLVNENLENLSRRNTRRIRLTINLKYGIDQARLSQMIQELRTMAQQTPHVTGPVEASIDGFGENTLQVVLSYYLPEPLPQGTTLTAIKQEISLRVYGITGRYTAAGDITVKADAERDEQAPEQPENDTENSII